MSKDMEFITTYYALTDFNDVCNLFNLDKKKCTRSFIEITPVVSTFNDELRGLGTTVTTINPLFDKDKSFLEKHIHIQINETNSKLTKHFDLDDKSVADVINHHKKIADKFLVSYADNKKNGFYQNEDLSSLPFTDRIYDIALLNYSIFDCNEFRNKPIDIIIELLRIAGKIKLFPITNDSNHIHELTDIMGNLQDLGYRLAITKSQIDILPDPPGVLAIWNTDCELDL